MSKVHAVLLVPEPGDPHGLLREGPCGARPPLALRRTYPRVVHEGNGYADPTFPGEACDACGYSWPCDTPGKVESEGHVRWSPCNRHSTVAHALVLVWGGRPVAEGLDRARHAGAGQMPSPYSSSLTILAEWYALRGYGAVVLLDGEGREVTP